MMSTRAIALACEMLRGNETYLADAREGAPVGNSVVGSLLSLQHGIPRQYAEEAVGQALAQLDSEAAEVLAELEREERAAAIRHTLPRSGQAPLVFSGELLAEADGERMRGRERTRWHELAVYRTAGGKYVVRIAYRTRWEGELDRDVAEVVGKAGDVAAVLLDYDPVAPVRGFPPGDSYVERQARLLAEVRECYDALVTEILAADLDFAEEVP